jgi:uncharacterized protein (TIGR02453 family)
MASETKQGATGTRSFSPALFTFLRELRANNDRDWFKANKPRYVEVVQEPALEFVSEFEPHLRAISPHFVADPRPVGGSLFRIHRDTRFSKDKSPYKLHTGIHFRHELAQSAHAPGFYLHLEPDQVFLGAGIWRPDTETLAKIRTAIATDPERWTATTRAPTFADAYRLAGDSLKRAPAGFDPEHPLVDELKRKDFIAVQSLTEKDVCSRGFLEKLASRFGAGGPFVRLLCDAIGVPF